MLDDTIEILTNQMIEEHFKVKQENKEVIIKMRMVDLYRFCIKLIKLIKEVESN